jgi:hypothetical protein
MWKNPNVRKRKPYKREWNANLPLKLDWHTQKPVQHNPKQTRRIHFLSKTYIPNFGIKDKTDVLMNNKSQRCIRKFMKNQIHQRIYS